MQADQCDLPDKEPPQVGMKESLQLEMGLENQRSEYLKRRKDITTVCLHAELGSTLEKPWTDHTKAEKRSLLDQESSVKDVLGLLANLAAEDHCQPLSQQSTSSLQGYQQEHEG